MEKKENDYNIKNYLKCQQDICNNSNLYENKCIHNSKILMLFAELFSFIVDYYGINNSSNLIIQYSNSKFFKNWFWNIKHLLGEKLNTDPDFYEIGTWIGKGFFLKIALSFIYFNKLFIDQSVINKIVFRQKKILKEIIDDKNLCNNNNILIECNEEYYIILNEKIYLSNENECFYINNIIK